MSRVIESDSFALPVVRETTQLSSGIESLRSSSATIAATARRRARLMESVFDDDDIYAWFEPGGDGSLCCAFATVPGYLLGENVRNWLRDARQARDFVYCERMGNQRAVVLVIDGRVIKDAVVGGYELSVELGHALGRLDKVAPGAYDIFLHGVDAEDLQLADRSRIVPLEHSVLDWMEDAPGPLPELHPTNRAISVIDVVAKRLRQFRVVRTVGLAVGSIAIAVLGFYWWQNRPPPPPSEDAAPPPLPTEVINARYGELLRTPDPGELIPAMHRAYRLFLGDPIFGELLDVGRLQWTSAAGRLMIETSVAADVAQGSRRDELLEQVRHRATMRGWGVDFAEHHAVFSLPVVASNRVDELRLPRSSVGSNRWHETRLSADLEALGSVTVTSAARNQVYLGYSTVVELRELEWAAGDTAAWLANRLSGGPLVLDSVVLESGSGAAMNGEFRFTTLWCVPAHGSTGGCAFENARGRSPLRGGQRLSLTQGDSMVAFSFSLPVAGGDVASSDPIAS